MRNALEVLVLFAGICSAVSAQAGEVARVKCGPNQDRVWVYDSLTTFDLQSKIRCGEAVEIVGWVKGFIKVRTQDGSEGYIPDSALPNVSPQEGSGGKSADANAAASTASLGSIARGVAARPAAAAVPPAKVQPAPSITKSVSTVASVGAIHPKPSNESAIATASAMSHVNPNAKSTSAASGRAIPTGAKSSTPQPHAGILQPNPPASDLAPTLLIPAPAINTMTAANVPVASLAPEKLSTVPVSARMDSDEFPDFQAVNDSADPACQTFFSAYGLAPSQLKWIAQIRKKRFPSVCPAPDPSKVDFVVIFTHDVNVYDSALPVPVHTDRNGFSDFSPMVGVDTALMSNSAADKAKYEFVWVFFMKRGSFDPAVFSPRRRYQFTRVESNSWGSKAGVKAVEDAFQFVALQGPSH